MRNLSLSLLVALAFGCGGSDITSDKPIDANPNAPDAYQIPDANPNAPDTNPNAPDANTIDATAPADAPVTADASPDAALIFCNRYEDLCGYDPAMNRFDDEAACLAAYESFSADRQTCVEGELDLLESDSDLNHCRSAMGRPPCN